MHLTDEDQFALLDQYRQLPAFPDVAGAIAALVERGHTLLAFSNGTESAVRGLLEHASILHRFRQIVSVDGVRTFKPAVDTENPIRIENAGFRSVREIIIVSTMTPFFIALLALVTSTFRTRAAQQAEIVALRHQIAVLQQSAPRRLRLRPSDRLLWIVLSRFWPGWRRWLRILKPDTVPALASKGVYALLDPQIASPAGKARSGCCDSRSDSTNEPGQFLVGSASHSW